VLQGGEDAVQNDEWLADVVRAIRAAHPDKAITLSVGERSAEAYHAFREAGADRYLLRHETRNDEHYSLLHPQTMSASKRRECLKTLKEVGYQTGSGMMIGSPGQTVEHLIDDLQFLEELQPEMIGIGPFIPATGTPFADEPAGSIETTLLLISLLRLRFPDALIPATTALATLHPDGRKRAILTGANVVMPNLSPPVVRNKYSIYDNKATCGCESAEEINKLEKELNTIGYHINYARGDYNKTK
jgi:biotin synthase